jgi:dolichol-phosphate mannosyltransferase
MSPRRSLKPVHAEVPRNHGPVGDPLDLALVIPAYNEAACIVEVVGAWAAALDALGIDYKITVLDDGSTDGTGATLSVFADNPRVEITTKPNSGHGPTLLVGYRAAAAQADWVFQCDGDDEMSPDSFGSLWGMRHDHDALFGSRMDRRQTAGRRLISSVSRIVVRLFYARVVDDVNTPYRLMRSMALAPIVAAIPDSTFAPNLVISGTIALAGLRIANIEVPHHERTTGTVSIVKWRLWRSAARSLVQTVALAPAMRAVARGLRTPSTGPEGAR